MNVAPCTIQRARDVVRQYHRHNRPPVGGLFAIAAEQDGKMIGVAIVGRPVARAYNGQRVAEVTRTCTLPGAPKGTVSFLYAACRRAAAAHGYLKVLTYTLASESGASLRGAGWEREAELKARKGWDTPSRRRKAGTVDGIAKVRWAALTKHPEGDGREVKRLDDIESEHQAEGAARLPKGEGDSDA